MKDTSSTDVSLMVKLHWSFGGRSAATQGPKPSRDWVMVELERLGVRVVSGRLGRKAGEEDEGEVPKKAGT